MEGERAVRPPRRHHKNKDYYVYFSDVDKKHHGGWDGKDEDKDKKY